MIITVTPNPALDLGGVVDGIIPNEKNYVFNESRFSGGNAINVSRWLTRFQLPNCATGFLGGSVGAEIRSLLDKEEVPHNFVGIKGNTRISITVSNQKNRQQTRLSFPGPKIIPSEVVALKKQIAKIGRQTLLIIGGSFPPGFSVLQLNEIIQLAEKRNIPIIVDVPGRLLQRVRIKNLWLIKPNLTEFHEFTGSKTTDISKLVSQARTLAAGVRLVCITSVNGGALLISKESVWFGKTPNLTIKGTVGAGDSMVAAMASVLWRNKVYCFQGDLEDLMPELLTQGLAAAASTLSASGTALGSASQMRKLVPLIKVKKLKNI